MLSSWSLFNHYWFNTRVIIHGPFIGEKPIMAFEVFQAAGKTPEHIGSRHVMSALFNSRGDTS